MDKQSFIYFHSTAHKCSETGAKPWSEMTCALLTGKNSIYKTSFVMMTWNGWGRELHITNVHVLTTADVCHDERKGETKEK